MQALGTLHGNKTGRRHRGDPEKSGFGMHTIRDLIPYELGGTVDLSLAPEGVRCRLELPADWLNNDGDPVLEAVARASPRIGHT